MVGCHVPACNPNGGSRAFGGGGEGAVEVGGKTKGGGGERDAAALGAALQHVDGLGLGVEG